MTLLCAPSLSKVIQGVEFTVRGEGPPIRAVATRDLLERHFGAGDSPDTWIEAYFLHAPHLHHAVEDACRLGLPGCRHSAMVLTESQWEKVRSL